jgi:uncharacterized protein involved in type VI secretion and phage assembly
MHGIYDLSSYFSGQILTAEAEAGRVYEPVIGIVTDNKDPQRLGRVKVKLPVLSEHDATHWASIVMQGAGKNRGWFFIPEPDDEVLVMFEHGDINRPLVVGALWNNKDKPPASNPMPFRNHIRRIKSRHGSVITFDDGGDPKIIIEDGTHKARITLDAKHNRIVIDALDGDVCFQAPRGEVRVFAGSAHLSAGKNIEIHSAGAMTLGSDGDVKVDGGSSVAVGSAHGHVGGGNAKAPASVSATVKDVKDPYGS